MNSKKNRLSKQLLFIVGIAFLILFLALGVVLPKMIIPVVESSLYSHLSEPLKMVEQDMDNKLLNTEVAYLYVFEDGSIFTSSNLNQVIKVNNINKIYNKMEKQHGKFRYKNKIYYYYMIEDDGLTKIALSNDSYINRVKANILGTIFPIMLITFALIGLALVLWSYILVRKIEKLKNKIDNIDNEEYNHHMDFLVDDEVRSLYLAIEDMRLGLINQEKYRNQMYQNISHDFKTPLSVIKSYIEAVEDEVEEPKDALVVIKEQTDKLEQKVHSLLYLNKLDYLKDSKVEVVDVDMGSIINGEVAKFKFNRKDVNFKIDIDKKSKFVGTVDAWETILDNILSNFMRYAKSEIKITCRTNRIVLYNDGEKIDDDLLEGIFNPFRKGIKGQFGLGLNIVKKTLNMMDYDIVIKNEKKGVSFIITKGTH